VGLGPHLWIDTRAAAKERVGGLAPARPKLTNEGREHGRAEAETCSLQHLTIRLMRSESASS
jgi:hypothetical protein